eukprot:2405342-Alexandrium_andersonii.AAC.1
MELAEDGRWEALRREGFNPQREAVDRLLLPGDLEQVVLGAGGDGREDGLVLDDGAVDALADVDHGSIAVVGY